MITLHKITRKLPLENLRVKTNIKPETINETERTVEVIFSTGARGRRDSWFGSYYEELEVSNESVNLERLNSGAPLLIDHDSASVENQVGIVERAWIDGNVCKALVRFARDEKSEIIFQKVRDGILKNISVGYDPSYEEVTTESDDLPVYRATKWEPFEVSLVTIPFDMNAQIRGKTVNSKTVNILTRELNKMPNDEKVEFEERIKTLQNDKEKLEIELKEQKTNDLKKDEERSMSKEQNEKDVKNAVKAEQTRCLEIRKLVKEFGMNVDMAEDYIGRNVSIEDVKVNLELFKKYKAESEQTPVRSTTVEVSDTNESERRDGIVESILHTHDSSNFAATERAKQFIGASLLRNLERHLGRKAFESDNAFVKRVMSTSDLPYILANVAEKTAQKRYTLAPKTFEAWTSKGTLKDFKESMQVRGGDVGVLRKMDEAGEYQHDTFGEEAEKAKLEKYGVIHSFSDTMLINDDLEMILSIAQEAGVAQARLDNKLAYGVLKDNPTMNDSRQLFSVYHSNLGTPAALGESSVSEARKAMRQQKSVDGRDYLNVAPRFLIVGPELETAAQKFLQLINPTKTDDVNVFARSLDLIVDAEIADESYFFAADPSLVAGVKVNRLAGQESVRVESRVKWSNDAIQLKLKYAVTANAADYRGLYKNEGDQE